MKNFRDEIIGLIDETLTKKETKEIIDKIKNNIVYKKEYELQKEIENYMASKFFAEDADNEYERENISEFINKTINEQNLPDFEILDYVTSSFKSSDNLIKKELEKLEYEAESTGIFDLTKLWVEEYQKNESEKDFETISYIKEGFNRIQNPEKEIVIPVRRKRKVLYLLVSSAAAVLIIFLLNFGLFTNKSNEELFVEYYETYEMIGVQIRNNSNSDIILQQATNYYLTNQFENAASKFKEFIYTDNTRVQAYFYLGISQIETKHYTDALQTFEEIQLRFDEYEIESSWYSALCLVNLGDNEKAVELLQEISLLKCSYQEDAIEILKHLE